MAYTTEQKARILNRIEEARKSGESLLNAIKNAGITDGTYYNWTNRSARGRRNTGGVKRAPKAAPSSGHVYVMIGETVAFGTPEQMSAFVKNLH